MSARTTSFDSRGAVIALASIVALSLAGCGSGSDPKSSPASSSPSASTLDTSDPNAVARAYGQAMAAGDCAAAARLHSTATYGIDCSDADMYGRWASYKRLGLTLDTVERSDDGGDSGDCDDIDATSCEGVTLVFTSATGYQPKEETTLGEKNGRWAVVNNPPDADELDPTAGSQ